MLPNFSLDVLYGLVQTSLLAHPAHRTMLDNKGKVKKEVQNTKFRSMVWNTDNCNMYPKILSMFYDLKFLSGTLIIAQCSKTEV